MQTNILHILSVHVSERCYNVPSGHYFHVETKILADFQIRISVSLKDLCFKSIENLVEMKIAIQQMIVQRFLLRILNVIAVGTIGL